MQPRKPICRRFRSTMRPSGNGVRDRAFGRKPVYRSEQGVYVASSFVASSGAACDTFAAALTVPAATPFPRKPGSTPEDSTPPRKEL